MAYELPSLQKKIDEFNELFELGDDWNVRYVVEEDDLPDSVLVHLYDYSETLDSNEFYGIGEYGELFPRWFERFEKAVQEDTGDADFYFEPYSYSGHFTGRVYLKGQKRWSSMKKKASDGWNEDCCYDLVSVLDDCYELAYEVKNCRRGSYCRGAGDTYESLGNYAARLGRRLIEAGEDIVALYGDLTAEEIDDMD